MAWLKPYGPDPPEPFVSVRDIKPVDGQLWAVKIRADNGEVATIIVDRQLATIETVAMAAHVVAVLLKTGRLPSVVRH